MAKVVLCDVFPMLREILGHQKINKSFLVLEILKLFMETKFLYFTVKIYLISKLTMFENSIEMQI